MRRIREAGPAADRRPLAGVVGRRCASASSTRWPTTSTRRGRWPRCSTGSGRPTGPPSAVGDADLREMLDVLGLDNLLDVDSGRARAEARELLAEREQRPGRARLRRGRPAARRAARAGLGGPRRPGRPRAAARRAVIVYGRNPVREAIRGPRTVSAGVGDQERRPRAVAGGSGSACATVAEAEEIERLCGSAAHQGVCAEVSRVSLRRRRRAAGAARTR